MPQETRILIILPMVIVWTAVNLKAVEVDILLHGGIVIDGSGSAAVE